MRNKVKKWKVRDDGDDYIISAYQVKLDKWSLFRSTERIYYFIPVEGAMLLTLAEMEAHIELIRNKVMTAAALEPEDAVPYKNIFFEIPEDRHQAIESLHWRKLKRDAEEAGEATTASKEADHIISAKADAKETAIVMWQDGRQVIKRYNNENHVWIVSDDATGKTIGIESSEGDRMMDFTGGSVNVNSLTEALAALPQPEPEPVELDEVLTPVKVTPSTTIIPRIPPHMGGSHCGSHMGGYYGTGAHAYDPSNSTYFGAKAPAKKPEESPLKVIRKHQPAEGVSKNGR